MRRLVVYLRNVKKEKDSTGKSIIRNTLSFMVKDDAEAQSIVADLNKEGKVSKWDLVNVK
jgi:hypothetical protein